MTTLLPSLASGTKAAPAAVLSILIVNWNSGDYLLRCLAELYAHPPTARFDVVVVDNASSDGSVARVSAAFPQVVCLASEVNLGFARANNRAAALAQGRYLLLLNPDTLVAAGTIDYLLHYLEAHPHVGAVGPRLLNADGTLQLSVERLPSLFREWWRLFHLDRFYPLSHYRPARGELVTRRAEVINGACLLLRRDDVPPPGLFDEAYFVYSEETDLCDRLREAGRELHWVPAVAVTHYGGRSTQQAADAMFLELYRNKILFFRKRRGTLTASLYKLLLLAAAGSRYLLGQAARLLPRPQRQRWLTLARQYGRLIRALPSM